MKARKNGQKPSPVAAPKNAKKGGSEAKAIALDWLGQGFTLTAVAEELKVRVHTVMAWRDSPDGQAFLAAAREKRRSELEQASARARLLIDDTMLLAAQTLRDNLAASPAVAVMSARAILDRGGVPAVREVKATMQGAELDLSKLTDEELETLDRIHAKARRE